VGFDTEFIEFLLVRLSRVGSVVRHKDDGLFFIEIVISYDRDGKAEISLLFCLSILRTSMTSGTS
jgi:hypothetical protein